MAEHESSKNSKQIIAISIAILFVLLVGFPIGSWFYLKSGLEYRKEVIADLHDYGQLPTIALTTYAGRVLRNEDVKNKILVVHFMDFQNLEATKQTGDWLTRLHEQFDERKDVLFLIHVLDSTATAATVEKFATQYQLQDTAQCFFLQENSEVFKTIATTVYNIPEGDMTSYFALTDLNGTVRRQYDSRKLDDVKRLIEHVALLIPKENRRSTAVRDRE